MCLDFFSEDYVLWFLIRELVAYLLAHCVSLLNVSSRKFYSDARFWQVYFISLSSKDWARDEKVQIRVFLSVGWEETHRKETKRMSKEAMNRWNKARLWETKNTGLERKSTKSRRVEGGVGGWQKCLKSCDADDDDDLVKNFLKQTTFVKSGELYSIKYVFTDKLEP